MNAMILGAYGLYFIMVGLNGNTDALMENAKSDFPPFVPWAFALGTLVALNEFEATAQVAKPFIFLLVLNFILFNFDTLESEVKTLYRLAGSASNE